MSTGAVVARDERVAPGGQPVFRAPRGGKHIQVRELHFPNDFDFCEVNTLSTGGSRFGAGRPLKSVKAERCKQIDVQTLHRAGLLLAGTSTWTWPAPQNKRGTAGRGFGVDADEWGITLRFYVNEVECARRIGITRTLCNFGGTRPWFVCPACGERVGVLFQLSAEYLCRHCHKVSYRSQRASLCSRTWIKQRKIERRLGPNFERPKGMHHKTYLRLLKVVSQCQVEREAWLSPRIDSLAGTIDRVADQIRQIKCQ